MLSTSRKVASLYKTIAAQQITYRMASTKTYNTLNVTTPKPFVYHVELNRPNKVNAMNDEMWTEMGECFTALDQNEDCRAVVISGAGKLFTAGIDVQGLMALAPAVAEASDVARKAKIFREFIARYQRSFTSIDKSFKPYIAAVHSACIGAGLDLITAVDIRYCTKDAYFQAKEVIIGMAADVGTLQRLPKIIGNQSLVKEICLTGRKMKADEALSCGLVSRVFEDKDGMVKGAIELAEQIAKLSPVAVQGTKYSLNYARDHSVDEGLAQITNWNQFMLQSDDFIESVMAQSTKATDVTYAKL